MEGTFILSITNDIINAHIFSKFLCSISLKIWKKRFLLFWKQTNKEINKWENFKNFKNITMVDLAWYLLIKKTIEWKDLIMENEESKKNKNKNWGVGHLNITLYEKKSTLLQVMKNDAFRYYFHNHIYIYIVFMLHFQENINQKKLHITKIKVQLFLIISGQFFFKMTITKETLHKPVHNVITK